MFAALLGWELGDVLEANSTENEFLFLCRHPFKKAAQS